MTGQPAPLWSGAFWRAYMVTTRPYLCFVSGVAGLVGLALVPGHGPAGFWAAFLAFFLSYGLGQALTDVFQTDTDALSAPYRPLVHGAISRSHVLLVSLIGLTGCAVVFTCCAPAALPVALLGVLGLLTYSWAKRHALLGPPWNAAVVALLPVIGSLCAADSPRAALTHPALPALAATVFFSYAIFVLLGYFKDVEADRPTGYFTLPVRFGRGPSLAVSALVFLGGTVVSSVLAVVRSGALATGALALPRLLALACWGLGLALLTAAHVAMRGVTRDEQAHPAIAHSVRGFVLLHSGHAALLRADLLPPLAVLYALFELALARRPTAAQI